jgi:hypothetical protein
VIFLVSLLFFTTVCVLSVNWTKIMWYLYNVYQAITNKCTVGFFSQDRQTNEKIATDFYSDFVLRQALTLRMMNITWRHWACWTNKQRQGVLIVRILSVSSLKIKNLAWITVRALFAQEEDKKTKTGAQRLYGKMNLINPHTFLAWKHSDRREGKSNETIFLGGVQD